MNAAMDHELTDKLDAAWGDEHAWTAHGLHWLHLDELRARNNRQVSGDPGLDALDLLAQHVAAAGELPLPRVLVLGCGHGWLERRLRHRGLAQEVVAIDLSPKVLELARRDSAGTIGINYLQADMNKLPVGAAPLQPGSFDAVLGWSSVHHCEQLEALYRAIHELLRPGGWFFLDEYVGPDRFQFSDKHLGQVRSLASLLPDRLLTTRSGFVQRGFARPPLADVITVDPSEAAASSRILPLLHQHFEVLAQRPYGGTLLHVLLANVAQNFQPPGEAPWLKALIAAEDDLDRGGLLENHFSCAIARRRG
jgi:SAM-dependent methyltransferase